MDIRQSRMPLLGPLQSLEIFGLFDSVLRISPNDVHRVQNWKEIQVLLPLVVPDCTKDRVPSEKRVFFVVGMTVWLCWAATTEMPRSWPDLNAHR